MFASQWHKKCLIIAGGDKYIPDDVRGYDFIIACDKGYDYAVEEGICPGLVIGDFDSIAKPEITDEIIMEYPPEKDDTDTMLAVKYALENGYHNLTLCSVFGGRFDHTLANVQTAGYIAAQGASATLVDAKVRLQTLAAGKMGGTSDGISTGGNSLVLKRKDNCYLSIFSLTNECKNVSIHGAKYELTNGKLTNIFPLGVSNCFRGEEVKISLEEGILLVVEQEE